MAITNGYITLDDLHNHVMANGGGSFTAEDDANMMTAINAASRWIDNHFSTSFYPRTETRYYGAEWNDLLYVDDLLTITTLKTDDNGDDTYETTWTTTDYHLEPKNAALGSQPKPYRQIRVNVNGDYSFPTGVEYGIEIAGTWGYCTAANRPSEVTKFTLLMAHRMWKRKDAIFGVAGTPALGVQVVQAKIELDSDLIMLLKAIDRRGW